MELFRWPLVKLLISLFLNELFTSAPFFWSATAPRSAIACLVVRAAWFCSKSQSGIRGQRNVYTPVNGKRWSVDGGWGRRKSRLIEGIVFFLGTGGGCFFSTELFHIHQLFADQNPSKCHAGEVKDQDPPIWLIGNPVTNQSTLKLKRLKQSTVKHILTMIFTTRFSFTSMFPTPLHFQAASRPHHLLPPSTKPDQTSDVSLNHKLPLGLRWGSPIFYVALVLVAISILQESPGTRKMSFYCKFEVPLLCIYNEMQDLDFLHGQAGQSAVAVAMCSSATNR